MKKEKKKAVIAAGAVLLVLLAILAGVFLLNRSAGTAQETAGTSQDSEAAGEKEDPAQEDSASGAQEQSQETEEGDGKTEEEGTEDIPDADSQQEQADQGLQTGQTGGGDGAASQTETAQEESREMNLPYTVPGTGLVIDHIDSYTGVFVEDGSDENVENIFAAHITNSSDQNVEYAKINASLNGTPLSFEISDIPAGAGVTVLESSRTGYAEGTLTYIDSQTAYTDSFSQMEDQIGTVVGEDNGITVTNLTQEDIPCIRIFYKFASGETEYIGGITYTAKIDGLEAGGSMTIYPSHFSAEGSRIMMVRRYESAE